jgi:hypothetical protein
MVDSLTKFMCQLYLNLGTSTSWSFTFHINCLPFREHFNILPVPFISEMNGVGYEVFTTMTMKNIVVCDVTSSRMVEY